MLTSGWTKLDADITDSTIWQESLATKVVWVTLLARVNREGFVSTSIPGLAKRAGVSLEECEKALEKFQRPDKYSRSQEEEGRRIRVVEGGFYLINFIKYRDGIDLERRRAQVRESQRRSRARKKAVVNQPQASERQFERTEGEAASQVDIGPRPDGQDGCGGTAPWA